MIFHFKEIAFLTDRDLSALLSEVDNNTLLIALCSCEPYTCDPFVKERILAQFSFIGWKTYEMEQAVTRPSMPGDIIACQNAIVSIANRMIDERAFEDYHTSWRA